MKKFTLTIILNVILIAHSWGQSSILTFDGVDDYVDLGTSVGNDLRSIEMWFRPSVEIDNSNSDFRTLIARNNGQGLNENEFNLFFSPIAGHKGQLGFVIEDNSGNPFGVYSDNNSWDASRWYHVAVTVSPVEGMMMFIDGVKQVDTDAYSAATGTINTLTAVGKWGDEFLRYFEGSIDDVRLSSSAIYTANFTPPCPDLSNTASTVGLWNFNEASGNSANDSSVNSYNGQIYGAIWDTSKICTDTLASVLDFNTSFGNTVEVYPNPSKGSFHFEYENTNNLSLNLIVYNALGQEVLIKNNVTAPFEINIEKEGEGAYYYHLTNDDSLIFSGLLIKQ